MAKKKAANKLTVDEIFWLEWEIEHGDLEARRKLDIALRDEGYEGYDDYVRQWKQMNAEAFRKLRSSGDAIDRMIYKTLDRSGARRDPILQAILFKKDYRKLRQDFLEAFPVEPARGSSVYDWVAYYHKCRDGELMVNLTYIAERSSFGYNYLRNVHAQICDHKSCERRRKKDVTKS